MQLQNDKKYISSGQITIVITGQLPAEIKEVTSRQRLKKYFPQQRVSDLLQLLEAISGAHYLITGDKDLLAHHPFKTAAILTPASFEEVVTGT